VHLSPMGPPPIGPEYLLYPLEIRLIRHTMIRMHGNKYPVAPLRRTKGNIISFYIPVLYGEAHSRLVPTNPLVDFPEYFGAGVGGDAILHLPKAHPARRGKDFMRAVYAHLLSHIPPGKTAQRGRAFRPVLGYLIEYPEGAIFPQPIHHPPLQKECLARYLTSLREL
jgi:hypothetical protein